MGDVFWASRDVGEPCTGRGNPFSVRDVTLGNFVLGFVYGGTSIEPWGTFFWVRIRNIKEILHIGVCGGTSVGPGELFLGLDSEYEGKC